MSTPLMKCPRCQTQLSAAPDAGGSIVCSGCGARLRTRAPAASGPPPPPPADPRSDVDEALSRLGPAASPALAEPNVAQALQQLLVESRALRQGQQEILSLLRMQPPASRPTRAAPPEDDADSPFVAPPPAPVRSRHRKSVLLIDDDERTRAQAVEALQAAEVPVRAVGDGNEGLAAMARERPDVVVLELDMGGSMAGKDVVNMIKATMEWVDIPIVLHTRMPIESQKEARQIHGADELVPKAPASSEALVARVIAVFRRS